MSRAMCFVCTSMILGLNCCANLAGTVAASSCSSSDKHCHAEADQNMLLQAKLQVSIGNVQMDPTAIYTERPLVAVEGHDVVGSISPLTSVNACKQACTSNPSCNSFAVCQSFPSGCWMKDKIITMSDATSTNEYALSNRKCKTWFRGQAMAGCQGDVEVSGGFSNRQGTYSIIGQFNGRSLYSKQQSSSAALIYWGARSCGEGWIIQKDDPRVKLNAWSSDTSCSDVPSPDLAAGPWNNPYDPPYQIDCVKACPRVQVSGGFSNRQGIYSIIGQFNGRSLYSNEQSSSVAFIYWGARSCGEGWIIQKDDPRVKLNAWSSDTSCSDVPSPDLAAGPWNNPYDPPYQIDCVKAAPPSPPSPPPPPAAPPSPPSPPPPPAAPPSPPSPPPPPPAAPPSPPSPPPPACESVAGIYGDSAHVANTITITQSGCSLSADSTRWSGWSGSIVGNRVTLRGYPGTHTSTGIQWDNGVTWPKKA